MAQKRSFLGQKWPFFGNFWPQNQNFFEKFQNPRGGKYFIGRKQPQGVF